MKPVDAARPLLVALVLIGACGKEKTTALDIELQVSGAIDQVRIDSVALGGRAVPLDDEQKLFPTSPQRTLKTGDVLTIWFADSADGKTVGVVAMGLLCGRDATASATTMPAATTLAKGQTAHVTLALANDGTTCPGDGGAGGSGGAAGAGGSGGAAGTSGAAGAGGSIGGAGDAGTGGVAGTGATAGTTGAAGRGGTTGAAGSAGTGGAAGRGGTTGTAGTGGAAGRGGTTGTAGTGGAAGRGGTTGTGGAGGRGGTTGTGGAAGRGGSTGTGGTGANCATTPLDAMAQAGTPSQVNLITCGYPLNGTVVQYSNTGSDYIALASPLALANGANCGRCVELVYMMGTAVTRTTVTVVGSCDAAQCPNQNAVSFAVSLPAFQALTPNIQSQLPMPGTTLKYSFVPCPATPNQPILANVRYTNGAASSVLFVQQRYGITAATLEDATTAQSFPLSRGNDGYWFPPSGATLGGSPRFHLTDVNNAMVVTPVVPLNNNPFWPTGTQFLLCPTP